MKQLVLINACLTLNLNASSGAIYKSIFQEYYKLKVKSSLRFHPFRPDF